MAHRKSGKKETSAAVELVPTAPAVPDSHVTVQVVESKGEAFPVSLEDYRQRALEACGLTPEIFRKIGRVLDEGMDAKVVQRLVVSQGRGAPSEVEEYVDIDHRTRLSAAREAGEILGVKPSRSAPQQAGKVQVNVAIAPWLKRS